MAAAIISERSCSPPIASNHHVGFTARRDLEGLAHWYETVFGMTRVHAERGPTSTTAIRGLCAGTVCVALFRAREGVAPRPAERPIPTSTSRSP